MWTKVLASDYRDKVKYILAALKYKWAGEKVGMASSCACVHEYVQILCMIAVTPREYSHWQSDYFLIELIILE